MKRLLVVLMAVLVFTGAFPVTGIAAATTAEAWQYALVDVDTTVEDDQYFSSGDGKPYTPYGIGSAQELANLAYLINNNIAGYNGSTVYYELTADIILNDWTDDGDSIPESDEFSNNDSTAISWTPIGRDSYPFSAVFDGKVHTISGVYIDTTSFYQGLFGFASYSTIKSIGVVDSYISGFRYVGGVLGYGSVCDILSCYNTGSVCGSDSLVGGVAGNISGTISYCYNTGSVKANSRVGGGVAGNISGTISYCYNTGSVKANSRVGGITGFDADAMIEYCYNSGSITGSHAGGIVGYQYGVNNATTVQHCYNTGSIAGDAEIGGVVGFNIASAANAIVQYCYNTGCISGGNTGGVVGNNYESGEGGEAQVQYCYNTGCIDHKGNVGGVVGKSGGTVSNCFYDKQMSPVGGIDGSDTAGAAEGKRAVEMTGTNLSEALGAGSNWTFSDALYPRLSGYVDENEDYHMDETDMAIVSVTPVFLYDNSAAIAADYETSTGIIQSFHVGIGNSVTWSSNDVDAINLISDAATVARKSSDTSVTLTATLGAAERMLIINVTALEPEPTPSASIDYENEELTGLTASAGYKINGASYSADTTGRIVIESAWFGTTLAIVTTGNGTTTCDSSAQSLGIPARPSAPSAAPELTGKTDTSITVTAVSGQEYNINGGETWQSGNVFSGLTASTSYSITGRVVATASAFASDASPALSVTTDATENNWVNPYKDVDESDWFYLAVRCVTQAGLMNGTSENSFSPELETTRGMIVTILWRLEDQPEASGSCSFKDVNGNAYYAKAVAWAAEKGIVTGYDPETYGPSNHITREQLAAILYRYAKYKGYDVTAANNLSAFSDTADVSGYALAAMKWAVAEGLISGTTRSTLSPGDDATRAQVATILMRYFENVIV